MTFEFMLPWFVSFLVLLVVLMFLIRYLLKSKDLAGTKVVKSEQKEP